MRARLPVAQIEVIAAEEEVKAIRPAEIAFCNKVNTSQGVVAHRADTARSVYGTDG
jgi:hypothetical protein